MSWYLWVWGGLSTLAALLWVAAGGLWFANWVDRRNDRRRYRQDYRGTIDSLEMLVARRDEQLVRTNRQLQEALKGKNSWGQISP